MVNPGGPSKACKECKERRVKCDLEKPECGPCRKTGKQCSGAKAAGDLFIVDQTNKVARNADKTKAQRSKTNKSNRSDSSDTLSLISASSSPESFYQYISANLNPNGGSRKPSQESPTSIIPKQFPIDPEQPAIGFYYDTYVRAPSATQFLTQHLSLWNTLYTQSRADSPVHQAAYALALAVWAGRVRAPEVTNHAQRLYQRALTSTRAALADNETSQTNETLFAVLLLSEYEQNAAGRTDTPDMSNLRNYNRHIRGAVDIVLHRGHPDHRDETTLKLFRAVRLRVVLDSVMRTEDIPGVTGEAFYEGDAPDPENDLYPLYKISLALPGLRRRVRLALEAEDNAVYTGKPLDAELLERLIGEAQDVDKRLVAWQHNLPLHFRYCSIPLFGNDPEDPEHIPIWPGMIHYYRNCFIASFLNNYRIIRIYLQELIARCAARLGHEEVLDRDSRQGQVLYVLRQMVDEICGTVPYLMGADVPDMPMFIGLSGSKSPEMSIGSWLNLRPLYVASKVECIPKPQKKWIYGRLIAIANEYGYRIANDIGKEASPEPEERPSIDWNTELPHQQKLLTTSA